MTSILIADTHTAFRASLLLYIASEHPDLYIGQAKDLETLIEKTRKQKWDLIFLDIKLHRSKKSEITKQIKAAFPDTKIYLTGMFIEGFVGGILRISPEITGYLSKERLHEELLDLIEKSKTSIF